MMVLLLFLFFVYPFEILTLALHAKWIVIAGSVLFVILFVSFHFRMKRLLVRELHAVPIGPQDPRHLAIERMLGRYAPDDYRLKLRLRVYRFPNSEPEVRIWLKGRWRFDLFVSEGFFDRANESDWAHFFRSWSSLSRSMIRRQNRRLALRTLFDRWKGPSHAYRYWWVTFCLYPLERSLKISKL